MLTPEEIQEFKKLVKETKNIELTDEEAEDQGSRLIQLFELLIKIDQRESKKQPIKTLK